MTEATARRRATVAWTDEDAAAYLEQRRTVTARVKGKLIEILQLPIEEDQIGLDSPLFGAGLGLDSVDAVGLAAMIEEHFGVRVFDTDIQVFRSINTIVDFVLDRQAEKAAGDEPGEMAGDEVPADLRATVTPSPELAAAFDDYVALRNHVGLVDQSAFAKIEISGEDAEPLVDFVVAGNVAELAVGSLLHSLVLDESGAITAIVWLARQEEGYLLLSSSRRQQLLATLERHGAERRVEIIDRSDEHGMVALLGPRAQELIVDLFDDDLLRLGYGEFEDRRWPDDTEILIGRFGEIGEFDYRLIVPAASLAQLAAEIEDAGSIYELRRCSPSSLGQLMLEMKTVDQETALAADATPPQVDLQWMIDLQKEDFLGREEVLPTLQRPQRRSLVLVAEEGGEEQTGSRVLFGDRAVGRVQTSAFSFTLERWIYLAYLDDEMAWPHLGFRLESDTRPALEAISRSAPLFITRTVVESLNV